MNFNDYQDMAKVYAFPHIANDLHYMMFGLGGEAGECLEKVKKIIRDKNGIWSEEDKLGLALELSDQLWYISNIARILGYTFEEIAQLNLHKLQSRKDRGVLGGSGDSR